MKAAGIPARRAAAAPPPAMTGEAVRPREDAG
jgi:hypothetical protein